MRKLKLLFALLFVASIGLLSAQTKVINGQVVSAEDNSPIIGARVVVKGTTTGNITDQNGKFKIKTEAGKILEVTYLGMKPIEVKAKDGMVIRLNDSSTELDEVMVVAYGTAKKSAFTGSAAVVNTKDLSKRVTTNVTNALVGTVPGLQLRGGSGAPGSSGGAIKIRGIASLYAGTDPLIILDGAPYPLNLSNIPQDDIESISVLKDAAAAALYGARGAAGVIIVTTKKGKKGNTRINVDAKYGMNTRAVQEYNTITDPGEYYEAYYAQLRNKFFFANGLSEKDANIKANDQMIKDLGYNVYTVPNSENLIGLNGRLNPNATLGRKYTYNGNEYYMTPDNWTDLAYSSAVRQEYNLSMTGGSDKSSFYASVGYLDEDGIIEYSDYNRISARIKADYKIKKWLKVGANVGYMHSITHSNPNMDGSLGSTNLMYYTSMIAPIYPVYVRTVDGNGNPIIRTDEFGNPQYDYGVPATNYGIGRAFMQTGNPLGSNRYNDTEVTRNQMNSVLFADARITDDLMFSTRNTVIWGGTMGSYYDNPFYGPKVGVNGELTKTNNTSIRTNSLQTLTYLKNFSLNGVKVLIGHEYYKVENKYLDAVAQGGFSPDIKEINAFAKPTDSHSYTSNYNVEGYFGNIEYNYDEKYFGSLSYRRDATSRFYKENRWGNFWSVGGAWLLSKENFLSDKVWIDELKLKASIGQQGNDNINDFAYVDTYSLSKATDTKMSPTFARLGNPDITWETTTNVNAGTEFSFWKGRLSGGIDVYSKTTSDLLFWISIPESSGSRGYYGNIGDIRNTGIELVLNASLVRVKDFDWTLSLNLSHNKTKILSLPESKTKELGGFYDGGMWYAEGGELYNSMNYSYAGVNDKGEALYWYDEDLTDLGKTGDGVSNITNKPGNKKSGTTTEIGHASRYTLGSNLPKVYGGIGTTVRIKNFDASFSFDYQLGGKVNDSRYATLMSPVVDKAQGYVFHKDWKKAWSPNNTESNIPRWQYGDKYAANSSDRFLTNASYFNFQSFTVGYTLPTKLIKSISKARLYVAGENLYFWSARKGLDPRRSFSGNSMVNNYSPVRNISGGIQLIF